MKNVTIHNAPILSVNAGEQWLGIAAADNSISLHFLLLLLYVRLIYHLDHVYNMET